jgi:hypothetical protein
MLVSCEHARVCSKNSVTGRILLSTFADVTRATYPYDCPSTGMNYLVVQPQKQPWPQYVHSPIPFISINEQRVTRLDVLSSHGKVPHII